MNDTHDQFIQHPTPTRNENLNQQRSLLNILYFLETKMTDGLQDALLKGLKIDAESSEPSSPPVIPIIERSRHARKTSQKLSAISPVCVLVVGMAGSGKTTLMSALQRSVAPPRTSKEEEEPSNSAKHEEEECEQSDENDESEVPVGYCLNLDPATKLVPFGASIDIRDTIDYKVRYYFCEM